MNTGYLLYQAERTMSGAERRDADAVNGKLAKSLRLRPLAVRSMAGRGLRRPVRSRTA